MMQFKQVAKNEAGLQVGVGMDGAIYTSTDGQSWTQRTPTGIFNSVAYGNRMFVAVGKGIFSSPDGVNWTERTPGKSAPPSSMN